MPEKILITGKNGYIGKNVGKLIKSENKEYDVSFLSLKSINWDSIDLSEYDIVLHLAGLVHEKETKKNYKIYNEVNYELTKKISTLALESGVRHFIFMSTIAVYGVESLIHKSVVIDKNTPEVPITYYGKSKLKAEVFLNSISCNTFKVTIIRPPMVYGEGSPGNYNSLEKVASISPIFPLIENEKSAVSVNKLSNEILKIIEETKVGTFIIQDDNYMNTSQTVKNIALSKNKKIYLSKTLGNLICIFGYKNKLINKIFGNLIYEEL